MGKLKKGIEALGQAKYLQAEFERIVEGRPKPDFKQMRPNDLPADVDTYCAG